MKQNAENPGFVILCKSHRLLLSRMSGLVTFQEKHQRFTEHEVKKKTGTVPEDLTVLQLSALKY